MIRFRIAPLFIIAVLVGITTSAAALEFTQRQVQLDKDLTMNAARKVSQKLFKLNSTGSEPILLIISTRAGFAPAAMIVADAISAVDAPVYAVIQPEAFGVGAIVAAFCEKRYAFRNASVLFSKLEYTSAKQMKDNPPLPKAAADAYVERVWKATAERLDMDADKLTEKAQNGWFLTAEEGKRTGIITEIVSKVTWVPLVVETTEIKRTTLKKVKRPLPAEKQP